MHLHVIRIKRLIDTMNNCLAHGQKYLLKHGRYMILILRNQLINQRYEVLQVSRLKVIIISVQKLSHIPLFLYTLQSFNMREIAIGTYLSSSSPRQIIIRWMYCRTPECSNSLCTTTSKPRKNIGSGYKCGFLCQIH